MDTMVYIGVYIGIYTIVLRYPRVSIEHNFDVDLFLSIDDRFFRSIEEHRP